MSWLGLWLPLRPGHTHPAVRGHRLLGLRTLSVLGPPCKLSDTLGSTAEALFGPEVEARVSSSYTAAAADFTPSCNEPKGSMLCVLRPDFEDAASLSPIIGCDGKVSATLWR